MTACSDCEPAAMLADGGSDPVVWKYSLGGKAPERIRKAVCAFANDLPGHRRPGLIFVGVDEAGQPTGADIKGTLLRHLATIVSDPGFAVPPTLVARRACLRGEAVGVIIALPSDAPPFRCHAQTWVCVGPPRARDERILRERGTHHVSFDAGPVLNAALPQRPEGHEGDTDTKTPSASSTPRWCGGSSASRPKPVPASDPARQAAIRYDSRRCDVTPPKP